MNVVSSACVPLGSLPDPHAFIFDLDQTLVDSRVAEAAKKRTFRTEAAGVARADELATLGIKLAKVQPRGAAITQTLLVVRDPQQQVVARLKDLQTQYPGTEVKVGACERLP